MDLKRSAWLNLSDGKRTNLKQEKEDGGTVRPQVRGKFIFRGREKFYAKGVTYGAFRPDGHGGEYSDLARVEKDFAQMAASGINTVRIPHTTPPRAVLDVARQHGLLVMVGLSAEQFVGHLADGKRHLPEVDRSIRSRVRELAGHPALLCYAIGNEIPASIARWVGRLRLERYLRRIYQVIKAEDPEGLVTYVNYPSTEYLDLPFLDLVCFNVYLEKQESLLAYLGRLQNIAGERPLIMSELGLDSVRHGKAQQARSLEWQIRTSFAAGCAGVIVFSWTDEWYRGGEDVGDWAFGITDAHRQPKPALASVRAAFAETPFPSEIPTPRFSVAVCTHNGAPRIRQCLEALRQLTYPNYEVIVVSDGSTDATAAIARQYGVKLIDSPKAGLSHARNLAIKAATGEFVAYIDDDAYPDPHWLDYMNLSFQRVDHVGMGGPNINPPDNGWVADCVSNSPGGPQHVLLTDELAEHIPGCNMVFRKAALEAIGGFDRQFVVAGDDVDVCWRLQEAGGKLGYCAPGMVWHHSRNTIRGYLRQQRGYGRAEALLEAKWPQKYNAVGHYTLRGRIYGRGNAGTRGLVSRVYHGVWGLAPFQLLYQRSIGAWSSLPSMPEWYLLLAFLAVVSGLECYLSPLLLVTLMLMAAVVWTVYRAIRSALQGTYNTPVHSGFDWLKLRSLTAALHVLQPVARLYGRVGHGLTVWRGCRTNRFALPWHRCFAHWTKAWKAPEKRLAGIVKILRRARVAVLAGDGFGRWDLEVRGGAFGGARMLLAVEDQGGGSQYVRIRVWPRIRPACWWGLLIFTILELIALKWETWPAITIFALVLLAVTTLTILQASSSVAAFLGIIERADETPKK